MSALHDAEILLSKLTRAEKAQLLQCNGEPVQIFTVDKPSLWRRLGRLSPERMASVDRAIKLSLAVG